MKNNEEVKIGSPDSSHQNTINYDSIVADSANNVKPTDEPSGISHSFDTGYAIAYGPNEALMIRTFQLFITANANRGHNFHEGRFWTYDRLEDFANHFPYWSIQTVRTTIASLIKQEVIVKSAFNAHWSNRTVWYAFKDQDKFIKNIKVPKTPSPLPPSDLSKQANGYSKEKIADLLKSTNDRCENPQMSDVEIGNCNIGNYSITSSISISSLKVSAEEQAPSGAMSAKADEKISRDLPQKKSKKAKTEFSDEVVAVADEMIKILKTHELDYSPPPNLAPFRTEVDFLLRIDKRESQKIFDVLNWALSDSFWRPNIFKPNPAKYLREKFLQLKNKMDAKAPEKKIDRKGFAPCSDDKKAYETLKKMEKNTL